jgi:hypothetical protein
MPGVVSGVSPLAGQEPLPFNQPGNNLTIRIPQQPPDSPVSVLAIHLT